MTIDQDKDVLAAEYVLGTLGGDERSEAQALIAIDPAFADVVRGWERRLGELSAMVDPVEPPADMWDRIKAGVAIADRSASVPPAAEAPKPAAAEPPKAPVPEIPKAAAVEPPALAPAAPEPSAPRSEEIAATPPAEAPPLPEAPVVKVVAEPPPAVKPAADRPSAVKTAAERPSGVAPAVVVSSARPDAEVVQLRRRVTRWQSATAIIGALAACFAAVVLLREVNPNLVPAALRPQPKIVEVVRNVEVPSTRPAEFVAIFQKDDASPAFLLTFDLDKRMLTVSRVGAEPQAGKSYELWLVSDKFPAPRSLGVVGGGTYTVKQPAAEYDPVVINRATYAISLEPEGGSPTGAPTGPVLYHGKLLRTTPPDVPRGLP